MFRVKIDFGALKHDAQRQETPCESGLRRTAVQSHLDARLGDWAQELRAPAPQQLTKEDLCRTFHDKFLAESDTRDKDIA
ncbi:hypothetical protein [Celeribacter halophilus]|uniref:hypothetical protein n=1 Tax=Celeribacter halophilus TaxID=576117 RepID=UPI003A8D2E61